MIDRKGCRMKVKVVIILLVSLSICFGIKVSAYAIEKKLVVVTTLFPLYDFAHEVGKDMVELTKLIPAGVEVHAFEPKPQDIATISKADIFIYNGSYMEPWVKDMLKGISNNNLMVVDASYGIELMDHESQGKDPHIWLNLAYAQMMTDTITDALVIKDPQHKDFYTNNAIAYKTKLAHIDARLKTELSHCINRTIVYAGHFAFGYFAQRYGLHYVSPYRSFSPDAEPAPKSIKELIDIMRKTHSRVIYYEELIDPKVARVIAQETGAQMVLLDGAHNVSKDEFAHGITFLSIMEEDLRKLKEGLECR
jgi:zinc transport system substrate-binding protein